MFFGFGGLHWMDIPILLAFGLSIWAQFKVQGTFRRWAEVPSSSGITGYEAARRMLDNHGLYDVKIEPVQGTLTDHYDPIHKVVRLSEPVYGSTSIAAISVACHEVGHAIRRTRFRLRTDDVPGRYHLLRCSRGFPSDHAAC